MVSTTLVDSSKNVQKILSLVSAMAMVDEDFKRRLTEEPISVLNEFGLTIPADMKVEICTSFEEVSTGVNEDTIHLVIPQENKLSNEDMSLTVYARRKSCQTTASTAATVPSCASCVSSKSSKSCKK